MKQLLFIFLIGLSLSAASQDDSNFLEYFNSYESKCEVQNLKLTCSNVGLFETPDEVIRSLIKEDNTVIIDLNGAAIWRDRTCVGELSIIYLTKGILNTDPNTSQEKIITELISILSKKTKLNVIKD